MLDNEIYAYSNHDFSDIRLKSTNETEGYFIQSVQQPKQVSTSKQLTASHYNRKKTTFLYIFAKPFDVETIILNIEDRNFESTFDVYADGTLLVKDVKIFDYSRETGNRNFTIHIPKTKTKELKIVYHLDKTTSFYKKYRNVEILTQYLSIKSIRCLNTNQSKKSHLLTTTIPLESNTLKEKKSTYFFKSNNIPFSKLTVMVDNKNFKRSAYLYASDNNTTWHLVTRFSLFASTFNHQLHHSVNVTTRAKYLKIDIENGDNKPLEISTINIETLPKNLYFIAQVNETYKLYFGDKKLPKPYYELESLVDSSTPTIKGVFSPIEKLKVQKKPIIEKKISFFEQHKKELFTVVILLTLGVMGYIAFILLRKH